MRVLHPVADAVLAGFHRNLVEERPQRQVGGIDRKADLVRLGPPDPRDQFFKAFNHLGHRNRHFGIIIEQRFPELEQETALDIVERQFHRSLR